MNFNQNEKIDQIHFGTLIVGVDIGKGKHIARAVDDRGKELANLWPLPTPKKDLTNFCFGSERSKSLIPNNTCCLEWSQRGTIG
jgi:hypothetical protein